MAEACAEKQATILVVDDTPEVLDVVLRILENAGFDVLHANSGPGAVKVAGEYPGKIDLLLSDVQMPGMSGPALADKLRRGRPDVHVMLMSAFTGGVLSPDKYGWVFIEKPFAPKRLIETVNVILHNPTNSPGRYEYESLQAAGAHG
jgi:two-component system cell cycle sensor histidine kinase/response regulator CckA